MADRFDELMRDMADSANATVDYQALHDAVLFEEKRRRKHRDSLIRTIAAAAVFVVCVGAGAIMLSRMQTGADSTEEYAVESAAYDEAPMLGYAMSEEDTSALTAGEAMIPDGCTDVCTDEPAAEAAPRDLDSAQLAETIESMLYDGGDGAKSGSGVSSGDMLIQSSGGYYDIGTPADTLFSDGDVSYTESCTYTRLNCENRVLDIGSAYITSREAVDGGDGYIALWQISETDYALVEAPALTLEELVSELQGAA